MRTDFWTESCWPDLARAADDGSQIGTHGGDAAVENDDRWLGKRADGEIVLAGGSGSDEGGWPGCARPATTANMQIGVVVLCWRRRLGLSWR
jgi:hypothetical protein